MSFKYTLYSMLEDLSKYHRDKKVLLTYYINQRLNKSLETYYKDLSNSFEYLTNKNDFKVLKNINKD